MDFNRDKRARLWIWIGLTLATALVYWRGMRCDFVNFDDPDYILENSMVNRGLSAKGIVWAFTTAHFCNWHPITWISHMIDCQLFGLNPAGHHAVNLLFHILNTLLLFEVLRRATGAFWRSAVVAALFALHPMHVESVAWIAERKDVLSAFFGFLALWFYIRHVEKKVHESNESVSVGGSRDYWIALIFFALGLMSKPMLVTWPCVLLLLDWWPLKRFDRAETGQKAGVVWRRLILEKWPWFVLVFVSSVVTFIAQKKGGAVSSIQELSMGARVIGAIVGYARYIGKLLWPENLAVFYPRPNQWPLAVVIGCVLLLAGITAMAFLNAKRRAYLGVGWFWFLGTLVPVIGIVQVGQQAIADRYTYIPAIGIFIMAVWGAAELASRFRMRILWPGTAAAAVMTICGLLTMRQVQFWRNGVTLFEHALAATQENPGVHWALGLALLKSGDPEEALAHERAAFELNSRDPNVETGLARVLENLGRTEEALQHRRRVAELQPGNATIQNNLAVALANAGREEEALMHYAEAAQLGPRDALVQYNFGNALARAGKIEAAIGRYSAAIRLRPDYADAYNNLAAAQTRLGLLDQALTNCYAALRIDADSADAYNNLGTVMLKRKQLSEAIASYAKAAQLSPTNAEIHFNFGLALARARQSADSLGQFDEAVRLAPAKADYRSEFGRALFLNGQLKPAIEQLGEAVRLKPDDAQARLYLGLAYFESKMPDQAVSQLREAARLRPDWVEALNAQAWLYATCGDEHFRNGTEAVRLAEQAATLTQRKQPAALYTLSAAYAEAGRFDDAVKTCDAAAELARENPSLSRKLEAARKRFQDHKALRQDEEAEGG